MKCFLVTILVVNIFSMVHSKCCEKVHHLLFTLKDQSALCSNFDGWGKPTGCHTKDPFCGDGKPVKGYYCGVGKCNIFGCNCDGGCIPGNILESFIREYGARNIRTVEIDPLYGRIQTNLTNPNIAPSKPYLKIAE
uniref:Protein Diedel-like n=1 Tax=Cacopsylla melanoneura TaxID=428564 RepID=A0A8D8X952_9HEMI